jgi:methionine-rich copper-binding protein CopC
MLLAAFLAPSVAHAFTGVVSVNGGTLVGVPSSATTVSVPIQISSSNPLNGFDIQVFANPLILQGASVDLSGSVLPSPAKIAVECINGILVVGTTCNAQDNPGVVHLAAATLGSLTGSGTTGTLFTINYNIIGKSPNSPIVFSTGCTGTSVAGDCVTINNGSPTPVPETDLGAVFSNQIDFSMAATFGSVSSTAGVPISDAISYGSLGGFSDALVETVTASAGLTATFVSSGSTTGLADLTAPTTASSDTLTLSAANGDYSATVQTCGATNFPTTCHTVPISVHVGAPGFTAKLSQTSVTISRGNSDSSTKISLTGSSGFSGLVGFTASSATSGITGSAPSATLTHDASGNSAATSTLTISVASTVATGTYSLSVTGASGSTSSPAQSISVVVPEQDFTIAAVPAAISIVRGGSVAANLVLTSLGNFAGTTTFSTVVTPVAGQQDSCCLTNNIAPAYGATSPALTAGGTLTVAFFASTVGGTSPAASYTKTGNYTAVVTASTVGLVNGVTTTISHSTTIVFNVEDFSIGPAFCTDATFSNGVQNTPNGNQYEVFVTTPCSAFTITDQPNIVGPDSVGPQTFWVQTNALGGLVTDGFNGTPAIAALNGELPDSRGGTRGVIVPQLAPTIPAGTPSRMCLLPTFFANGTQVPYKYLAANGPWITPGLGLYLFLSEIGAVPPGLSNWGCKFDAAAFPNDHGISELNDFYMTHFNHRHTKTLCQVFGPGFFGNTDPGCPYPTINNPDFFGVTAMSVVGTLPGAYTFKLCAQGGVLTHCQTFGLNVVASAIAHQLVVKKTISFATSGGSIPFKIGITNPDLNAVFAQVTVTASGSLGDSLSATSAEVSIGANANANNIALSLPITAAMIGETFTFSFTIVESLDPNNLDGTSTAQTIQQTITITP